MQEEMSAEARHLEETRQTAYERIDGLEREAETAAADIIAEKQAMKEETSHSIPANLWGSDAFEQLAELSQFATQISDSITNYENTIREIEKLKKLVDAPYFARVDFTFKRDGKTMSIYIGRSSLKRGYSIVVHDWRAPVSSLFYRYSLGPASYVAPAGTIDGDISLKRQYEIKGGELEYYFDADIEILDEYLRRMLSQNASPQMKSIVETIQREQDVVIRDESNDMLIVQGVAGSGKTSIALHRIAYLMYSGLTNSLSSQSIIIISPNNVFERYISSVLPELGEENVNSYVLDELYDIILDIPGIQTRFQMLEAMMLHEGYWLPTMTRSLEFKCSRDFADILDSLSLPGGSLEQMRESYSALFEGGRLEKLASNNGIDLPEDIGDIIKFTRENLRSSTLFFDDASALTYLYLKHNENDEYAHIRQVVIDEAQDYYYLHYRIFKLLYPNARYTILGDINQTIEKPESMDLYRQILDIFDKNRSSLVTLEKSFRCSNEIIRFSAGIAGCDINAFGREGEQPELVALQEEDDVAPLIADVKSAIADGYQSTGIICKSERDCRELHSKLPASLEARLIDRASTEPPTGVFILPVYLSKGLEFDSALMWGVDNRRYGRDSDRSLLFIGCTRALHRLRLYYSGEVSRFIPAK